MTRPRPQHPGHQRRSKRRGYRRKTNPDAR